MNNLASWNFHSLKNPVGCSKAQMQFPPPHILRGGNSFSPIQPLVEISGGRLVETGGITTPQVGV